MNKTTAKWIKIAGWSIAGILVLAMLVLVTGVLLIEHSPSFRQRILAKVARSVQESTGARLEVKDFHVHLRDLSLDLYDITVHGSESNPSQPLLTTDHIN